MKLLKLQNADNQVVYECASKKLKKYCKKRSEKLAGNKKVRIFAAQFGNDPTKSSTDWVLFELFWDGCAADAQNKQRKFIDKFEKDYWGKARNNWKN